MRVRVVAVAAVFAALAAVTLAVWVRTLPGIAGSQVVSGMGADLTAGLLAVAWTVTGAVLLVLRPRNSLGWLVVVVGVCQAVQQGLQAYGGYGVSLADPAWPGARWVAWLSTGLWLPGLLPLPSLLLALYPNGRLPSARWRWPVGAAAVGIGLLMFAFMLAPEAYDDIATGAPPVAAPQVASAGVVVGGVLVVAATVVIWVGTAVRLARVRPPERQQLAWLLCVAVPFIVVGFLPGAVFPEPVFLALGFLIPVAVAVGVLRYHLLGIEVVLRRGPVYGILTAVVVGVYLAVTAVAGTQLDRGPLPGVVAAALVAVGLTPARDRLQAAVDRLLYGDRRNPMRAVTRLGNRMATAEEADLLPTVLATVTGAMRAPGAAVHAPDGSLLAARGTDPAGGAVERLPLRVGGRNLGELTVAPRAPGEPYTGGDRRLLAALAPQVAVVVRALDLAEALGAERDRVVAATRRERDRLRRDLHDGLGPLLAGVRLGLQALQDAQVPGGEANGELLSRIRDEMATAVGEVRRIIDDLRPAVLDSTPLPEAIRRHAAWISTGRFEVSVTAADIPLLPPDVETAAYRITQEALTNAARHAAAHHATVTLGASNTALTVTVADDGHGINESAPSGVGLNSMRHRAQTLHGTLQVDSSGHGTTVVATFPLEDRST